LRYRQWELRNAAGEHALLFIGTTATPKLTLHWSGELGYQGDGYVVTERGEQGLRLRDGHTVTVSRVRMRRLADRLLVQYGVVSPDGISARGAQSALRTAWDALRGSSGPYYVVRVAGIAVDGGNPKGPGHEPLLATVLWALSGAHQYPY
jgi:hypothetical protein